MSKKENRPTPQRRSAPQAQRRDADRSKHKNVAIAVLVLLILLLLTAFFLAIFWDNITKKPEKPNEKPQTSVSLVINGVRYDKNAGGVYLTSGSTIQIIKKSQTNEQGLLTIVAVNGKNFSYKVGNEPYHWSDEEGKNFYNDFKVEKANQDTLTVTYASLEQILSDHYGKTVTIDEGQELGGADLFAIKVTLGDFTLKIGFRIGLPVEGVTVEPSSIVM